LADLADLQRRAEKWTRREVRRRYVRALKVSARDGVRIARAWAPKSAGKLRRSIASDVSADGAKLTASAPYAAAQEYGGIIRAKRSRYLAIPLRDQKHGPRSEPGLFAIEGRGGPVLVRRSGDGVEPRFALRESIRIRGRGFMRRGFSALRERAVKESLDELRDLMRIRGGR